MLIFTAVEIEPIQTLATPIYNPLEPTEEIQPKPESITPQEKSEPEQPAPIPPEDQKTTVPSEEKKPSPKKKDKPVEKPAMSKEKKKQTKETTAHPLQVNKDFVFPNGLGAGGDEESESYLAAVGYFLSGNGLYGKKMDVREVYDIDDVFK
ncbi:hypothetical protein YM116_1595 [Enterococcus faecalis]|nr:hypothetical protein YM116_1595 [Enterococcus faecalis]